MSEHQLQRLSNKWWRCSICQWDWQSKPKTSCPGVPRYSWETKPDHFHTKTELSKIGLKLVAKQPVCGIVQSGDGKNWWRLYDKTEAIAKRRNSPSSKSTRQPCPIGLDCLLVAAVRGKPCPNKNYCRVQAKPWSLPYNIKIWADGTRCLEVDLGCYGSEQEEKMNAGYMVAERLPHMFVESDLGKPILTVYWSIGSHIDWYEAEDLSDDYPYWVAARKGATYEEFLYFERDTWRKHWCYNANRKYYEREIPEYPHCVLPGTW